MRIFVILCLPNLTCSFRPISNSKPNVVLLVLSDGEKQPGQRQRDWWRFNVGSFGNPTAPTNTLKSILQYSEGALGQPVAIVAKPLRLGAMVEGMY